MKLIAVIILVVCLAGCGDKDGLPSGILKKEKMQALLWDFIQAESYTTLIIKKDSLKNAAIENAKLQQQIFAINNVSKEEFYNSYDYYSRHAELMRPMLDSISSKGEREKYTRLYQKEPVDTKISLMALPPLPPSPPIPLPITAISALPSVQPVQSTQKPAFNKIPKPNP